MIDQVTNSEGIAVLERLIQFSGARQRLIAGNIANFDTPGYRPVDVSVDAFQEQLAEAVEGRRASGRGGPLQLASSDQVVFNDGGVTLHPEPIGANLLFHDGNDRDLERTMQSLVENFLTFRLAAELMRSRFDLINSAIRERV